MLCREAEGKVKESTTGEAWLAALLILTSIFPPLPPCAACGAADCKEEASYLKQFAAGSSHSLFLVRRYSSFPSLLPPTAGEGGGLRRVRARREWQRISPSPSGLSPIRLAAADGKVTAGKLTFIFSYLCPFYSLPPSPSNSQQAAAVGKGERVKGGFSLTWHCDEKGMPFATVQFEIFIAAAYSRILDGKTVRVFPYTLGYALYGAEYPILHYTSGKMGLPTKDSPNVHNAARMCAIVRNWLRTAILQWAGQDDGPVWVADEEAWRFSPGKYFNVFIKYPHLEEVRGLPEEIVGDEKEDKDFADVDASVGGEEDEDEDV
ncbi:unnamed protein product [Closterium sp. NIES-64]|nr:unnamed protein product [Closterium sp. NIES-64]